ncbi:MAG: hypothetical protein IT337_00285 [Thermomicrobiales bacterium]|nr:hypothetical protein [Thermomicrobiales bacterium]
MAGDVRRDRRRAFDRRLAPFSREQREATMHRRGFFRLFAGDPGSKAPLTAFGNPVRFRAGAARFVPAATERQHSHLRAERRHARAEKPARSSDFTANPVVCSVLKCS